NQLTGEFTCIMLRKLASSDSTELGLNWDLDFFYDFSKRFSYLLAGQFQCLDAAYALELLTNKAVQRNPQTEEISAGKLMNLFTDVDVKRLKKYTQSLVDFHVVADLCPRLADLYFSRQLPQVRLNKTQQTILLALGLQRKTVDRLASEFHRLLGSVEGTALHSSTVQHKLKNEAADASAIVSSFSAPENVEAASQNDSLFSDTSLDTNLLYGGWPKRIRGLLFVIMRELNQAVEEIKKDSSSQEEEAMQLDVENEESEDEAEAMDIQLEPEETERRRQLVRELLISETETGAIDKCKVKGSKEAWQKATAGHGSTMETLHCSDAKKGENQAGGEAIEQIS
ncbi:N-acetyltransferase 10, partial [Cichlidogyrus casuarinus]